MRIGDWVIDEYSKIADCRLRACAAKSAIISVRILATHAIGSWQSMTQLPIDESPIQVAQASYVQD